MRAHRGSFATGGSVGFEALVIVAVIFICSPYGTGRMMLPMPAGHTPILAFKFAFPRPRPDDRGECRAAPPDSGPRSGSKMRPSQGTWGLNRRLKTEVTIGVRSPDGLIRQP